MTVIILNSGRGSRLGALTANSPKCMTRIAGDETILSVQLEHLHRMGLDDVYMTTGYLSDVLEPYALGLNSGVHITFIGNKRWEQTNYIVSLDNLWERLFSGEVVLMHGDLVFSEQVLTSVIRHEGSCVVVDSNRPIPEKDFKARIGGDGFVKEIGVNVFGEDCLASQPLYKLTGEDWRRWRDAIHSFCRNGQTGVYAENALNTITDNVHIQGLDVKGDLCMEVDDPHDLATVRAILGKGSKV